MRCVPLRRWGMWVVPVLFVSVGLALPATGAAAEGSEKLDPSVKALLKSPLTTPWTRLRVIAATWVAAATWDSFDHWD